MKFSKQWKLLTRDQRRAWQTWAKNNRVLLVSGEVRRVSAVKAFTIVLQNRAIAGDAANPTTPPQAVTWLNGALSVRNTGPFTIGTGSMNFRAEQNIASATKWFVWATLPIDPIESKPLASLQFVKFLQCDALAQNALTPNFADDYRTVHGSFNGPGTDGEWPTTKHVWFRLHQYHQGQLGPGVVLKGTIAVEL